MPQFRVPAMSHGVTSLLWAIVFAVYIWLGGVAIGWSRATAFVVAVVAGFAIFVVVRVYGDDDARRP